PRARRQWRALGAALGLQGAMLTAVSLWLTKEPLSLIQEWLTAAKGQQAWGMIDLPSLLQRGYVLGLRGLVAPEETINLPLLLQQEWPNTSVLASALSLIILLLMFATAIALRHKPDLILVSIVTFPSAIFTYHRSYDLTLLIPALALTVDLVATGRCRGRIIRGTAVAVFAVALVMPRSPALVGTQGGFFLDLLLVVLSYVLLVLTIDAAFQEPDHHDVGCASRSSESLPLACSSSTR
ncbi:MAG: hypothetical protein IRY99_23245, partial [Isosphaeraceae bacterium]|nr:hypothetical protein [Isosphaeraceae bacterium]